MAKTTLHRPTPRRRLAKPRTGPDAVEAEGDERCPMVRQHPKQAAHFAEILQGLENLGEINNPGHQQK